MATPHVSSAAVKKYPITLLCGFSLLFMPSLYRLLFFFTPLLISTAIFVVAMLSWGARMPSSDHITKDKRRRTRNDWAFNGSLCKIDDEIEDEVEEEEEEEGTEEAGVEEVREFSRIRGKTSEEDTTQQEDITIKGKASNAPKIKRELAKLREPDPDYDEHSTLSNSASATIPGDFAEPDPDSHADQRVEPAHDQDFSPAAHAAPDHPHHLPAAHDDHHHHAENPDQHAAGDHLISYHNAEPDHLNNYHDAELNYLDCEDGEPNRLDYHDADLHEECAVHANLEEAHVENDDVHAAISELRQKLGMMKKAPYSDDPRDTLAHVQPAERLQTLQAAA